VPLPHPLTSRHRQGSGVPARSHTPSHRCCSWTSASVSLIVSGRLRPEPPPECSPPRSPWSFASLARKLLQLVVTGAPSTGRFLQGWPFLSSQIDSLTAPLSQGRCLFFFFSPLSICSFHRLRLLLFKAGFVDFAEYLSISISVTHGVLPLCSSVSVDLSVMGSITR
jgi:hypothetical protein